MKLLNASGCLDALTAPEVARSLDAFVTKTVTPLPREGNAPVRIAEVDGAMLNAIGLANPGRERFCAETLPRLAELGVPLWVSVGGFCVEDYAETCELLDGHPEVAAVELNLSCPNVDEVPENVGEVVAAARAETDEAALREALACRRRRRDRPRCAGRRSRRAQPREHGQGPGPRRADAQAGARPCDRRPLGAGAEAARARGGFRVPTERPGCPSSAWAASAPAGTRSSCSRPARVTSRSVRRCSPIPASPARVRGELEAELAAHGFADPDNAVGVAHLPAIDPRPEVEAKR